LNPHEIEMERLCDEVAELASHISAATARWLRLLGRLDDEAGRDDGYKTLAHWLAWRCGMTLTTARDHVRTAQALRGRPLVAEAFERGELSYSKVRALMRLDDDFDEDLMLAYARYASASQLETIVRGCRRCTAVERDAEREFADRSFSWSFDDEGGVVFKGRLPAEQGSIVVRALEAARDELGPPPIELTEDVHWSDAQETMSPAARRADAFIAAATTALAAKASSADVYQVVVHVDADSLSASATGDDARCTLEDGAPLPAEVARRLSCDATIVRILEQDGKPLSIGRKTRTVSPALRKVLRMRDSGCAFPGCEQRHHTDAHHVEHWADGGATNLDNLVQLCRYHHTLIHKARFKVRAAPDGSFTFLKANGTVIPQAPRQPRGDCTSVTSGNADRRVAPTSWSLYPDEPNPRADLPLSVDALIDSRRPARE
jgi:uncharacterized protein DUF222/HNH endonuclease